MLLRILITLMGFMLVSCQLLPGGTQKPSTQPYTFNAYQQGDLQIKWDPKLLAASSTAVNGAVLANRDFQILAQQAPLHEANYTCSSEDEETFTTNFSAPETNIRYRVLLKLSEYPENHHPLIRIYLNDQLIWNKIHPAAEALEIPKVLLLAQNTLEVSLSGKPDMHLQLQIVPDKSAGHVFRTLPAATVATQTLSHFSPDTGDLRPEGGLPVSGVQLDDDLQMTVPFESNVLLLELLSGQSDVPNPLQEAYGLETRSCQDIGNQRFCSVYFDASKAPIEQLPELLQTYRQSHEAGGFKGISFSSLQAMQTISLALHLKYQHGDLLAGVELNGADLEEPVFSSVDLPTTNAIADDWMTRARTGSTSFVGESWWILDTRMREAWHYSVGTGARAAYIDIGWRNQHPEIENRRFLIQTDSNQTAEANDEEIAVRIRDKNPEFKIDRQDLEKPPVTEKVGGVSQNKTHGITTVQVGFGERDNNIGAVGVAPNATVIPYSAGAVEDVARAITLALQKKRGCHWSE